MTRRGLSASKRRRPGTPPAAAILLLLALAPLAKAQDTTASAPLGIIDTVIITGNDKTKGYVILNEMTLKPGMTATREAIEFDRNRIYSLGLFTHVDIEYYAADNLRFLAVDVGERWYILPIILLGYRDGDPKKLYYGGGLSHNNFAGRNQKVYLYGSLGYDPQAGFGFGDPLFYREENIYAQVRFSTGIVRSLSGIESAFGGDYDERHNDVDLTVGKRFDIYQTADITPGYQIVQVSQYRAGRTASPTSRDSYLLLTLNYLYDSRDLKEFATQGSYFGAYVTKFGFGESAVDFARIGIDSRHYVPLLFSASLAARVQGLFSSGTLVPAYAHVYLGYDNRIRGYFSRVFEGECAASTTIELRVPILKARVIDVSSLPIPREFAFWRFGLGFSLFADAGTAWFQKDWHNLHLNRFPSGYGAGIDFLLPYSLVVRTEYALNNLGRGEFILDFSGAI